MAAAYGRMDVLVLPSRRTPGWEEPFVRVFAEALQCGVPMIGARSGEIPWVVDTTRGGMDLRRRKRRGTRLLLDRVATDPAERQRWVKAGRKAVGQRFSTAAVVSRSDGLLLDVAAARPAGRPAERP